MDLLFSGGFRDKLRSDPFINENITVNENTKQSNVIHISVQ